MLKPVYVSMAAPSVGTRYSWLPTMMVLGNPAEDKGDEMKAKFLTIPGVNCWVRELSQEELAEMATKSHTVVRYRMTWVADDGGENLEFDFCALTWHSDPDGQRELRSWCNELPGLTGTAEVLFETVPMRASLGF